MLLPFIIFILVSGAIIGGYFAIALLPGVFAARRLDRRLRDVATDAAPTPPRGFRRRKPRASSPSCPSR